MLRLPHRTTNKWSIAWTVSSELLGFCFFAFSLFLLLCRALDWPGHIVSFWVHVNLPYCIVSYVTDFWWQAALQGGRIFFTGEKLMLHWPVGSNAVGCSSRADAVIDSLLRCTQQWLTMHFSGPDNPQNVPFAWGVWTSSNTWFLGPTQVTLQTAPR